MKNKNKIVLIFTLFISVATLANDADFDGYSDEKEILLGTDPNINEFRHLMPEYTGKMSPFLAAERYQSHSDKEAQAVVTPDGQFLIGLRRYSLRVARIDSDGSLSQVQVLPTSGVLPIDHNDMDVYANYHLEVSPNGKYLAVYNPTLPRNKRGRIYNSDIELYEISSQCSIAPTVSLSLKKRLVLPNQSYNSTVQSIAFSTDSRFLISSSFDGLNVYRTYDASLDLVQNISGSFGGVAVLADNLATTSNQIFRIHSRSGYLFLKSSFQEPLYGMFAPDQVHSDINTNTFYYYRKGDDYLDGAYISQFNSDGVQLKRMPDAMGSSMNIANETIVVSMEGEEYGGIRVYTNEGRLIGRSYRALDPALSQIEEVVASPNGRWLFITTNQGTYTYKGAQVAKSHGDADLDGVLDNIDDFPLDASSY